MDEPRKDTPFSNHEVYIAPKRFNYKGFGLTLGIILVFILIGLGVYKYLPLQQIKSPESQTQPTREIDSTVIRLPQGFDQSLQDGPFNCPLPVSYCKNKSSFKDSQLQATFKKNTPILAAFEGDFKAVEVASQGGEVEMIYGTLINKDRGLRANYYYQGETKALGKVKAGQELATSSGKLVAKYNQSVVFELIKLGIEDQLSSKISLSMDDFK